jgi:hypothetical protein
MAESGARVDAVASKPVPAALVEPRALAVPELAISPLHKSAKPHTRRTEQARIRSAIKPTNHPTNGPPRRLQLQLAGGEARKH